MNPAPQQLARNNLDQLWWLRNIAIGCEITLVALASLAFDIALPAGWLVAIIGGQIALNIVVRARLRKPEAISGHWIFLPLLADVTALFALLCFSGGAANPFTSLFILQVILAATLLSTRQTWIMTGMAIGYYTLLITFWTDGGQMHSAHSPAHGAHHTPPPATLTTFDLHVYGMWGSFVLLALLVAWFVTRMQATIQRQSQLLAASEQVAMLGTIATSAAHALGTPLSSIALMAELIEEEAKKTPEKERAALLKSQIARCKEIISQMALKAGVMRAESGQARGMTDWLASLVKRWQAQQPQTDLQAFLSGTLEGLTVVTEYALEQAVFNLLDNAAEASPSVVQLDAFVTRKALHIRISDEGTGFPPALLEDAALLAPVETHKPGGMGMGLYLARMVAERLGGELTLSNRQNGGGCAVLSLPLSRLCP